eukprot:g21644.t1
MVMMMMMMMMIMMMMMMPRSSPWCCKGAPRQLVAPDTGLDPPCMSALDYHALPDMAGPPAPLRGAITRGVLSILLMSSLSGMAGWATHYLSSSSSSSPSSFLSSSTTTSSSFPFSSSSSSFSSSSPLVFTGQDEAPINPRTGWRRC